MENRSAESGARRRLLLAKSVSALVRSMKIDFGGEDNGKAWQRCLFYFILMATLRESR